MTTTDKILTDRGKRYGKYMRQASIALGIRELLRLGLEDETLEKYEPDQIDALHMIAVKLSRIVNGDPDYADNWRDIAGYATLVADRLEGKERP